VLMKKVLRKLSVNDSQLKEIHNQSSILFFFTIFVLLPDV
jgi:hypothetical protein